MYVQIKYRLLIAIVILLNINICIGSSLIQKNGKVSKYYQLETDNGNTAIEQYNLGVMYKEGLGTHQNYIKAKEWYEKAARQNNAVAQYNLGYMYDNGEGVEVNHKTAKKWFKKISKARQF